jgi:hypothetical protein
VLDFGPHNYRLGIPVYGNAIIQKSTPETADSDNAFVSLFKKCIINLAKHVQMASSFFLSIFCLFFSSFVVQYHSKGLIWNPNGSPFS